MRRIAWGGRMGAVAAAAAGVAAGLGCLSWWLAKPAPDAPPADLPRLGRASRSPAAAQAPSFAPIGPDVIQLRDVTGATGIAFVHQDGSSGRRYIMETMSAGLALFDYDNDGLIDIYFVNGAPLPGAKNPLGAWDAPQHALWRNLGAWRFQDVSLQAGAARTEFGLGVAAGDYDNDGFADLYLSNFGPNVLLRNRGDGTFADATEKARAGRGNRVGAGVAFLDADGDGHLDLFVGNYLVFSYEAHRVPTVGGIPLYPGPRDHSPETNTLLRNRGDGSFADASAESGVAAHRGTAMGVTCCDFDDDGDTDVFVANDEMPNFLFENDGQGRFQEVGIVSGVAFDGAGLVQASMGVDAGDYDNDGRFDFYVTSYQNELATLYRNVGHETFIDATRACGAGAGTLQHVTWGCGWIDFDNDGDRDLFVACGHTDDNIELRDPNASYLARNVLLKNLLIETGKAHFADVSDRCGDGLRVERASRGAAFDDLDNDGDIDVVVLNSRRGSTLLRNMLYESGSRNHWLQVRLQGVKTNRDGIGARVKVVTGGLTLLDEVHSGRGYQSHFGTRLHFGLGQHQRAERVEVRWIGGGVDVLEDVAADQLLLVVEGTGR